MSAHTIPVLTQGQAIIGQTTITLSWVTLGRGIVNRQWSEGECTVRSITIPHPNGRDSLTFRQSFGQDGEGPRIEYRMDRKKNGAIVAIAGTIDEYASTEILAAWQACETAMNQAQREPSVMADYTKPAVTYGELNGVQIIANAHWITPHQFEFLQTLNRAKDHAIIAMQNLNTLMPA